MGDGDAKGKTAGIPAWQKATESPERDTEQPEPQTPAEEDKTREPQASEEAQDKADSDMIEQGKRFLLDEDVRDASIQQRTVFLESKGLSKDEVERAIALAAEAASSKPQSAPTTQSPDVFRTQQHVSSPPPAAEAPPRDIAPIITYPEFLVHSQKPLPLITAERLLNTAYAASLIGAVFYGCSKYLIAPMSEVMTESRHDFALHAQSKIEELNKKLRDNVSKDPRSAQQHAAGREAYGDDTASVDSDPTELFHRDFGTQTSAELLEAGDYDSTTDSTVDSSDEPFTPLPAISHSRKLATLATHCRSLNGDALLDGTDDRETLSVIRVLQDYLESLAYPSYTNSGVYGTDGPSGSASGKKEDELSKFKAEIRSVKGTLLNARNFPSSASKGRRAAMFPPAEGVMQGATAG